MIANHSMRHPLGARDRRSKIGRFLRALSRPSSSRYAVFVIVLI